MMNEFREAIKREQGRILAQKKLADEKWERNEQGILVLTDKGNRTYCYEKRSEEGQRQKKHYIGTPQSDAAREFVHQRFLKEKYGRLESDGALLEEMLCRYQDYDFESIMEALPDSYRKIAFEDFNNARYEEIKRWANEDYEKNPMPFPNQEIYTLDGRRMRSKGECIHGNIYYSMGIPYRFDCKMVFENDAGEKRVLYPDFLIQCFNRKMIIIEHLGRLFDKRYALSFGEKCYWYLQDGFVLGQNFFVTSDDMFGGTDSRSIEEVAKAVERLFFEF